MKFSMLLQYITPHRKVLLGVVALLLAGSVVTLAQPWLAGQLTAVILTEESSNTWSIQDILLFWLALIVIRSVLGFLTHYSIGSTSIYRLCPWATTNSGAVAMY